MTEELKLTIEVSLDQYLLLRAGIMTMIFLLKEGKDESIHVAAQRYPGEPREKIRQRLDVMDAKLAATFREIL